MNSKAAGYDHEAFSYDRTRFFSRLGRHLDEMHKRIVGILLPRSSKMVLDAGAGTGRFSNWLSWKGFRVVGVDVSAKMLKEARRKARIMNSRIGLVHADVKFLPFSTGLFDSCTCVNVIDHVPDVSRFFEQVRYVVKPKGYFIFNFSNLQSPYLPLAIIVNLRRRALFKEGRIQSRWLTLKRVRTLTSKNGFAIKWVRGCFIASRLPLGDKLARVVRLINLSIENSRLKPFSGSLFVKAQLVNRPVIRRQTLS